jgi:hypothetical protein
MTTPAYAAGVPVMEITSHHSFPEERSFESHQPTPREPYFCEKICSRSVILFSGAIWKALKTIMRDNNGARRATMKGANDRGPVRLGDLIRDGKLLWLYCRECYRKRDVDPATIPLPRDVPVPEIGKHMKCSACGSRKIDSRPELYPGGIEAQRDRRRRLR